MQVLECVQMIIAPIFTGPFQNLKHRGYGYAQKRAIYENFSGNHVRFIYWLTI